MTAKEHSLIFSGPMVNAILDGRKTQTRRIVTHIASIGRITEFGRSTTKGYDGTFRDSKLRWHDLDHDELLVRCPYGNIGSNIWVRETWRLLDCNNQGCCIEYNTIAESEKDIVFSNEKSRKQAWHYINKNGWISPIYMPRWASRIDLRITDISVERVQDITEEDVEAEGCLLAEGYEELVRTFYQYPYREVFQDLWNFLNAKRGFPWESNPWVWKIEFERVE